jgi:hypothetical protein
LPEVGPDLVSAFDTDLGDERLQEHLSHGSLAIRDGVSDSGAYGGELILGEHFEGGQETLNGTFILAEIALTVANSFVPVARNAASLEGSSDGFVNEVGALVGFDERSVQPRRTIKHLHAPTSTKLNWSNLTPFRRQ